MRLDWVTDPTPEELAAAEAVEALRPRCPRCGHDPHERDGCCYEIRRNKFCRCERVTNPEEYRL